jgi:hypothetical protein
MDAVVGQDVDMASEQLFEILLEPDEVEQRPVVFHFDQEIDVAVSAVVTACDGTEYADVARSVLRGNAENLFAVPVDRHGWRSEAL